MQPVSPVLLMILDGWGIRQFEQNNAVTQAHTPNFDQWLKKYERAIVDASGLAVGLPEGQMGNSEVGHTNLGAGRVVYQDIVKIDLAIKNETIFALDQLNAAIDAMTDANNLHIIGLLGTGGVHSHLRHQKALLMLAKKHGKRAILHLITDGRDTPQESATGFLSELYAYIDANEIDAQVVSLSGRYYTMDRDKRWERIQRGYDVIVQNGNQSLDWSHNPFRSAETAIQMCYDNGVTDEFIEPVLIGDERVSMQAGDVAVFFNFRADRMRQIVSAFADEKFNGFETTHPKLVVLWFATHLSAETLINENMAMQAISVFPPLILAGVWASTLSSALGSILAAPRTLQAIALDRVVPSWMAHQMGSKTEPRAAVLLSSVIAVTVIWLGDLNLVAPIIAMFFLNTYGMVNLIAGIENLVGNPSFRPRFRIHWSLSILGALGCYGAMFLINTPATLLALFLSYGLYFGLQRRQLERTWGDVRSGILFALARNILLRLETVDMHIRNWRPNIIVFTGQPHNRGSLVQMASWLTQGRGIVTFFQLFTGNVDDIIGRGMRETARESIRKYIRDNGMTAFAEVEVVSNFKDGALAIAQAHGIGGLESNSVMMGWSRVAEGREMQMNLMRNLVGLKKSMLFLHPDVERGFGERKLIQVWWQGKGGNADLMLLLTHLINQHRDWRDARVELVTVVNDSAIVAERSADMQQMLDLVRVVAEPRIITRKSADESFHEIIAREGQKADLTLLGMQLPSEEIAETYSTRLHNLVEIVGTVLLVHNARPDEQLLE